jgi:hypothetical protein
MSDDQDFMDVSELKESVLQEMKQTFPTYGAMNMHLVDASMPLDDDQCVDTALVDIYQYRKANRWKWYCAEFCKLVKSKETEEGSVAAFSTDQMRLIVEGANNWRRINLLLSLFPERMPIYVAKSLYAYLYPGDKSRLEEQSKSSFEVSGIFEQFRQMGEVLAQAGAIHPVHALSIMGQLRDQFEIRFGEYNNAIRRAFELSTTNRWQPQEVHVLNVRMTFLHFVEGRSYGELGRHFKQLDTEVREQIRATKQILLDIPEEVPFPSDLLDVLQSSGIQS